MDLLTKEKTKKWLLIAFINLNIVALVGVVLRYKIAFSLPWIDQKHLLHAHSHFAFAGWITQCIMTLMVVYLHEQGLKNSVRRYRWLLLSNLLSAYGMLLSFPFEGYGPISIAFSTLSVLVSYLFAVLYWNDLNKLKNTTVSAYWFKSAILFNAISSIGTFALAYMMANKIIHQNWYLLSVYFYLHFQYNGWFFFACMGLLAGTLQTFGVNSVHHKTVFWLFLLAIVPTYYLSVLWMPIPLPVYILVLLAAAAQVMGWALLVYILMRNASFLKKSIPLPGRIILFLSAIALSIKLILQLGSTYPPLSKLAFGFHPIIIGYLHLVFLGVITLFLIGYILTRNLMGTSKWMNAGVYLFTSGIILNELLLMIQGGAALYNENMPYINELLLAVAVLMCSGILLLVVTFFISTRTSQENEKAIK
ncbi:MAG: hypothetical protein JSS76_06535 [Bacteroidetes bacterium]|nr:hypothetical protein [Bacteroidota bacterium]